MVEQSSYNDAPFLPLPLSPRELFATLMGQIEPELLEKQSTLDRKYKSETEKDRKNRGKRYEKAYKKFQKKYKIYMQNWKAKFRKYKHDVNAYIEQCEKFRHMHPNS